MDVDPMEYAEPDDGDDDAAAQLAKERHKSRVNTVVAVTVALLATFMAICRVKDDNIVQAMQQAQAHEIDNWAWYQARNIRADVAQSTADTLRAQAAAQAPAVRAAYEKLAATYQQQADKQQIDKKQTRTDAEKAAKDYDALNYHDDQFDLSEAALSLAIALLALTSLTQKRWLYGIAMAPTLFGVVMGLGGLFGWHVHPGFLTRLLS